MTKDQMIARYGEAYYEEYKKTQRDRYRNNPDYHERHRKQVIAHYTGNPEIIERRNKCSQEHNMKRYCCEPLSHIENYEEAKKDNFKGWIIHHRLELTDTGEFLHHPEDLMLLGVYWKRPAKELIFMRRSEHTSIHVRAWHKYKKLCGK